MNRPVKISFKIFFLAVPFLLLSARAMSDPQAGSRVEVISSNWKMQPSVKLDGQDEKVISQNGYDTRGWYKAFVPGTVLGSLALGKVIEDPTFGINMKNVDTLQFKKPW